MEQPDQHRDAMDPKEVKYPLILLIVGLVLFLLYGLIKGGFSGAGMILGTVGLQLVMGLPLAVLACFLTAKILSIDFGLLHTAILKLAAAFVFPAAVGVMLPVPLLGWLVSLVLYWAMLEKFFELEPTELVTCVILIFLVRLVAGIVVAAIVAG